MPADATVPLLCSRSPRRAQLLRDAGLAFEPGEAPDVDETPPAGLAVLDVARALAVAKARVAASRAPGRRVMTADTTVVLDGAILGKPADAAEAKRMLRALSGREHLVVTGVAVAHGHRVESGDDRTRVRFRELSDGE